MFTVTLFIIVNIWKQCQKIMTYQYNEILIAVKKNEVGGA